MLENLNNEELQKIDGGFIVTGMMIAAGIGCLGGGVAVGYGIGVIIRRHW